MSAFIDVECRLTRGRHSGCSHCRHRSIILSWSVRIKSIASFIASLGVPWWKITAGPLTPSCEWACRSLRSPCVAVEQDDRSPLAVDRCEERHREARRHLAPPPTGRGSAPPIRARRPICAATPQRHPPTLWTGRAQNSRASRRFSAAAAMPAPRAGDSRRSTATAPGPRARSRRSTGSPGRARGGGRGRATSVSARDVSVRVRWPCPTSSTGPSAARARAIARSARAATSAIVSPPGQPSRHRSQSGRARWISAVVRPS